MARPQRVALYAVGIGIWLSGALWLLFRYVVVTHGQFGVTHHPLEAWWLTLHGAFAVGCTWMFGVLWTAHIVRGWRGRQRRRSGAALVALGALLIVSGYLLYYLGDERLRSMTSVLHWSIGLGLPLAFGVHRLRARSLSRARQTIRVA